MNRNQKTASGCVCVALLLLLTSAGCTDSSTTIPAVKPTWLAPVETVITISPEGEKWGVQPLYVRLSAGNNMLDFRYRVVDKAKAEKLVNRKVKPFLLNEQTGSKAFVPDQPKIAALRHTGKKLEVGRTYFALFGNPGMSIKRGDKVTVVMADYRMEHLTVE